MSTKVNSGEKKMELYEDTYCVGDKKKCLSCHFIFYRFNGFCLFILIVELLCKSLISF